MKFETKYNIGDKVWLIKDNTIQEMNIKNIGVFVDSSFKYNAKYGLHNLKHGSTVNEMPEKKLFSSKEELLNSL